ncbi:MAG: hypothetical protein HZC42_11620 [Candidatus Eisenbacteria bacterium]|nr:hypothetical protein [Candidatus Eisenbacteria bacterium]
MTFACLAIAAGAEAKSTWFGPQLAFPVPARDIGDTQLGIDAGVTLNNMGSSHVGVGVDLVYHYWPASPEYKAAFDRYLRSTRYEAIDGSTWAFSAFQVTAHLKLVAPMIERHGPWLQVGAGMYRLNRNLADPNWDDSVVIVVGRGLSNITVVPGWYASVGFDFRTCSNMVLGLDANYHHLRSENKDIPHFSAFTVGTRVLFGW